MYRNPEDSEEDIDDAVVNLDIFRVRLGLFLRNRLFLKCPDYFFYLSR